MKILFRQNIRIPSVQPTLLPEEDLTSLDLMNSIEKTRQALDAAYSGFDNAVDEDIIDSYIYEINALQKRHKHLTELAAKEFEFNRNAKPLYTHSPIRALISQVFS